MALFQSLAVVQHQGAVEKQHVRVFKVQEPVQTVHGDIADIYQGHFLVADQKIGGDAAAEGVPEEDQPVLPGGVFVFQRDQGQGAGEVEFVGVPAGEPVKIIDAYGFALFSVPDGGGRQGGGGYIIHAFAGNREGGLSGVDTFKGDAGIRDREVAADFLSHGLGQSLGGRENRLLPPVGIRAVVAVQGQGGEEVNVCGEGGLLPEPGYKGTVIHFGDVLQKVPLVRDHGQIYPIAAG